MRYIYGLHEPGGEKHLKGKGTILFTHELGSNPSNTSGCDYTQWVNYEIMARLNHGYGRAGTIPVKAKYDDFARRVARFVEHSPVCRKWIIGNEPNCEVERPDGVEISPYDYALCYVKCRSAIHYLPGHENDEVIIAGIGPWNVQTGDWLQYFRIILNYCSQNGGLDGIALHTYTHGSDPQLVFSNAKMGPPFEDRFYHFRAYVDFMNVIPTHLRSLPVYITETDQNDSWVNANTGWVKNAYLEINRWNMSGKQQIRSLILYRWPKYDKYYIEGKGGVTQDLEEAVDYGYQWVENSPPPPNPPPPNPPPPTFSVAEEARIREIVWEEFGRARIEKG